MFTPKRPSKLHKVALLLSVTAATALVVGSTTGATAMADGDPEAMAVAEIVDDSAAETADEVPAAEQHPSSNSRHRTARHRTCTVVAEVSAEQPVSNTRRRGGTVDEQPVAEQPVVGAPVDGPQPDRNGAGHAAAGRPIGGRDD